MTLPRALLLLLVIALPSGVPAQETVVTGVSTDEISLTANFDGSQLFVFGAVRRDAPIPEGAGPLDIIITIKGPTSGVMVRRKDRRFGIWVNTDAVAVSQAPSLYAIATTRPIDEVLSETERLRYQIGIDQAVRRVGGHATIQDTRPFAEALVRLREAGDLYVQLEGGVSLTQQTLFQARFELPANLVEGDYNAEFFLVRDREVISSGSTLIRVAKAGFERWIYNLSQDHALAYGVLSVVVALAAGWLAATTARLARR